MGWIGLRSQYVRTAAVTKMEKNPSINEISTIGLDLAKNIFQVEALMRTAR
jgi:hypothetical protein